MLSPTQRSMPTREQQQQQQLKKRIVKCDVADDDLAPISPSPFVTPPGQQQTGSLQGFNGHDVARHIRAPPLWASPINDDDDVVDFEYPVAAAEEPRRVLRRSDESTIGPNSERARRLMESWEANERRDRATAAEEKEECAMAPPTRIVIAATTSFSSHDGSVSTLTTRDSQPTMRCRWCHNSPIGSRVPRKRILSAAAPPADPETTINQSCIISKDRGDDRIVAAPLSEGVPRHSPPTMTKIPPPPLPPQLYRKKGLVFVPVSCPPPPPDAVNARMTAFLPARRYVDLDTSSHSVPSPLMVHERMRAFVV